MKRSTFSILFYAKKSRKRKDDSCPIYVRITINGEKRDSSTGLSVKLESWSSKRQLANCNTRSGKRLNELLHQIKFNIQTRFHEMKSQDIPVTSQDLMDAYKGNTRKTVSLLQLFQEHQKQMEELVEHGSNSVNTLNRYNTTLKHVAEFIKDQYKRDDLSIQAVDYRFLLDFEHYLKIKKKCQHNSSMKHMKGLRKIILNAFKEGLIRIDPFNNYKITTETTSKEYLTKDELAKMQSKQFTIKRLVTIRDMFLLQCYTGMAYCDIHGLKPKHVVTNGPEDVWIKKKRHKTNEEFKLKLLPPALAILRKYQPADDDSETPFLPISSNQKMNAYLKEVAVLCGIDKKLTTHLGRHTYATLLLNENVPHPIIQSAMGISKEKTLRTYAKLQETSIAREMDRVANQLKQ